MVRPSSCEWPNAHSILSAAKFMVEVERESRKLPLSVNIACNMLTFPTSQEVDSMVTLEANEHGKVFPKCQFAGYNLRGDALAEPNVIAFFVNS